MLRNASLDDRDMLAEIHAMSVEEGLSAAAIANILESGAQALANSCGFVIFRIAADEAEIFALSVVPAARRKRLGNVLLHAAMTAAAAGGAVNIFLEVAAGNTPARSLYSSAGFVEIGRRTRYYSDGADAILMSRRLTQSLA